MLKKVTKRLLQDARKGGKHILQHKQTKTQKGNGRKNGVFQNAEQRGEHQTLYLNVSGPVGYMQGQGVFTISWHHLATDHSQLVTVVHLDSDSTHSYKSTSNHLAGTVHDAREKGCRTTVCTFSSTSTAPTRPQKTYFHCIL